jgi:hypothetical protein
MIVSVCIDGIVLLMMRMEMRTKSWTVEEPNRIKNIQGKINIGDGTAV